MDKPLYKSLTDAALLESYIAVKALAYNAAQVQSRRLGALLRDLDIIVAVARQRGLQLPATLAAAPVASGGADECSACGGRFNATPRDKVRCR